MADRYFLNVGTDFNDSANWSTTSGGAGGASVPTTADMIFFDGNSGNLVLELDVVVNRITMESTYTGSITQGIYSITSSNNLSIQCDGGDFLGGSAFIACQGNVRINGGNFRSTSNVLSIVPRNGNDFNLATGTFDHNFGKVYLNGSNHHTIINNISNPFWDYESNACSGCQLNGTFFVDNDFTATLVGTFTATVTVKGNLLGVGNSAGGGEVILTGTNIQNYSIENVPSLKVEKTGGSVDFQNNIGIGTNWTYITGTLNWNNFKATINSATSHSVLTAGYFYELEIAKGTTTSVGLGSSVIVVETNFTITQLASLNSGTIQVGGNLISNDTSWGGSAFIEMIGSDPKTFSGTGIVGCHVIINKTNTFSLLSDMTLTTTGADFTLNSGTLNLNSFELFVQDVFTQSGGIFNGQTGLLNIGSFFHTSGVFNEGSQGVHCRRGDFSISIGAIFNRHVDGGLNVLSGVGIDLQFNANGNILSKLIFNRGSFSLVVASDVSVIGDYEFNGGGGQQRGTGSIYWYGSTYKVDGQRGGNQTTRVVVIGTGNQLISFFGASNTRGCSSLDFQKPSGRVSFLSDNNMCSFDDDFLVNMDPNLFDPINTAYLFNFISESLQGNMDIKTSGVKLPNVRFSKGAWNIFLLSDLEIMGYYTNVASSTLAQVRGFGFKIKLHGNYVRLNSYSGVGLSSAPEWQLVGRGIQEISSQAGVLDGGIWRVVKPTGFAKQMGNITIDNGVAGNNGQNNLLVDQGAWCTNGFDLTVDGTLQINSLGEVRKVTGSTITGTIDGTVTDVDKCRTLTNKFFLVQ
jgi:hypothetical protein